MKGQRFARSARNSQFTKQCNKTKFTKQLYKAIWHSLIRRVDTIEHPLFSTEKVTHFDKAKWEKANREKAK